MSDKHVLFLDDDKLFLDTRAIYLEREGYTVFKAFSIEQAEKFLAERWIQLIISDVRLIDPDDLTDKEGIRFAERQAYRKIPIIIITNWPTRDDTRWVLRPEPALGGRSIAIDYLDIVAILR